MRERFEENKDLRRAADAVLEALAGMERGEMLSHARIEGLTKFRRGTQAYYAAMSRVQRQFLRERNIVLWCQSRTGYRLCTHREQALDYLVHRARKAKRQLRRGIKAADMVPAEGLSEFELRLRSVQREQMQRSVEACARDVAITEVICKRKSESPLFNR